jgi:hypothetical protein
LWQAEFADITSQQELLDTLVRLRMSPDEQAAAASLAATAAAARRQADSLAAEATKREQRLSWLGGRSKAAAEADQQQVRVPQLA